MKIAVLLTVHNRRVLTKKCLEMLSLSIGKCRFLSDYRLFVVDDGSTDGTTELLESNTELDICVIQGDGSLYWRGGMTVALEKAVNESDITHFLWLNNDVMLSDCAIECLIDDYLSTEDSVIIGFTKNSSGSISYGLRNGNFDFVPFGSEGVYPNGNILFHSREILNTYGALSKKYMHGYADFEFGFRIVSKGGVLCGSSCVLGICEDRATEIPLWRNPNLLINKRWVDFVSPTGFGLSDYLRFLKDTNKNVSLNFINVFLKLIFPRLWR